MTMDWCAPVEGISRSIALRRGNYAGLNFSHESYTSSTNAQLLLPYAHETIFKDRHPHELITPRCKFFGMIKFVTGNTMFVATSLRQQ